MVSKALPALILAILTVLSLDTCFAKIDTKSYAVFVAHYNSQTGQAQGGVAGTAFFVSGKKAITAYHVLQPSSFRPAPGFDRVKIWLVHEDERPLELKATQINTSADRDMTEITLSREQSAPAEMIYKTESPIAETKAVEVSTDGFYANSTGPKLRLNEKRDLEITSVPTLKRLSSHGTILLRTPVEIHAVDVNLGGIPCLKLSYQPVVGLSGGPVISSLTGNVIAMNSFADPTSRQQTWAVRLN